MAYNIGPGAFVTSTALRRFNEGDKAGAVEALKWFNKAGGKKLRGLVRRREAEAQLFLTPVGVANHDTPPPGRLQALLALIQRIFGAKT